MNLPKNPLEIYLKLLMSNYEGVMHPPGRYGPIIPHVRSAAIINKLLRDIISACTIPLFINLE